MNFRYRPYIDFKNKSFREVLRILPARSIDQGVDYINSIVETRFASNLIGGSVTYYENALVLHNAPVALIGTSISTAAFPRLTERLAQGRVDLFNKEFLKVLRTMIWIALPVVVISFFARGYLARIIFARGSNEIAAIFGILCVALLFRILYTLISRYFYAHKDTKTPLYVSLFIIGLNIVLAFRLSQPEPIGFGVLGLALAQSIVAFIEVAILVLIMLKRDPHLFGRSFVNSVVKIISVTGFSAVAAFIIVHIMPLSRTDLGFILVIKLGIIATVTLGVHVIVSYVFGLEEAKLVVQRVKRVIMRPVKI
jgi:putative peptidoglycan lipid II flippase